MQKLFVKDIMTESPLTIGPEDSVVYAAQVLNEHGFNGLPVVDENKKLVGTYLHCTYAPTGQPTSDSFAFGIRELQDLKNGLAGEVCRSSSWTYRYW